MQAIRTAVDLKKAIQELEVRKDQDLVLVKNEFHQICEKLTPANIIRNTVHDFTSGAPAKDGKILNTTIMGVAAGLISKIITVGFFPGPIKSVLGNVLQLGVTSVVSKESDSIMTLANRIGKLFKRKEKKTGRDSS